MLLMNVLKRLQEVLSKIITYEPEDEFLRRISRN